MHQIYIIKTVIAKNINHQFVSGEIITIRNMGTEMMHGLNEPGLAAIIFHYTISYMAHRADGKNELHPWTQFLNVTECVRQGMNDGVNVQQFFFEPLRGSAMI